MRTLVPAAVACSILVSLSQAQSSEASIRKAVSIPAQELSSALQAFAQERKLYLIYDDGDVINHRTSGAKGELTQDEVLKQLLRGTGLKHQFLDENTIAVVPIAAAPSKTSASHSQASGMRVAQAESAQKVESTDSADNKKPDSSAEESDNKIQEVIVTAQKREERLQDVPMSIAVIGNEDIERRGLIGMEDYLRAIPGVAFVETSVVNHAIIVRGVTTGSTTENLASGPTVGSYFDETSTTGAGGTWGSGIDIRPVDIERIELLRGPQGTTFGSASLGGTLRTIPAKPKLDAFSARVAGSYSSTGGSGGENSMVQGVVNLPIVEDKFALRAVGYRFEEGGYYRNRADINPTLVTTYENFGLGDLVHGYALDDVGQVVSTGGRLSARWQPTEKLDLSLVSLTQKIAGNGFPGGTARYLQTRPPITPAARERDDESGETYDTQIDLLSLVLNYDFGWATLTSAASRIEAGSVYTSDLSFLGPVSGHSPSDFNSTSAEMRLASQLDGRLQFLVGLYYEDTADGLYSTGHWAGPPGTNIYTADPTHVFDIDRAVEQRAIFGEVSYRLTDKLTATVGGRYFEYDKNESDLRDGEVFNLPLGTGVPTVLESGSNDSTFKFNLGYKPTEQSLLYASWAEGFRLGKPQSGVLPGLCDHNNDGLVDGTGISIASTQKINSDFLETYEIGSKFTLFNQRLAFESAVYYTDWKGLPVTTFAQCDVPAFYIANVGSATSKGAEVQATFFLVEDLKLQFGVGYNQTELAVDVPAQGWRAGQSLPASPDMNANFSAQYDFDIAGHRAFVRADSFYTDEFYGDVVEVPGQSAGDYIKVDARAGVAIKNLNVELFVRNVTDSDAKTWPGGQFEPDGGYLMKPRTIGIQLGYSFE